jgi:hypothetical protein
VTIPTQLRNGSEATDVNSPKRATQLDIGRFAPVL